MGTKETQWSIGSNIDFFNLRLELSFFIISGAAAKQKIQRDIHDFGYVIIQRDSKDSGSLFFSINLPPFSKVSLFS